jgi:integrase
MLNTLIWVRGLSRRPPRPFTYCFRHIYATFRLSERVGVYFLPEQMGTSVKMIERHYDHITLVKNAERILQGPPGWEPIAAAPQVRPMTGRVKRGCGRQEPPGRRG